MSISSELLADLLEAAAASPRREICGLLFGDEGRITAARSTRNVAADPRDSFEIEPQALFDALRAQRAGGPRLIGHYHSHPGGGAEPSRRDAEAAEPGRYWLILGSGDGRLYHAEEQGRFRPVTLEIG